MALTFPEATTGCALSPAERSGCALSPDERELIGGGDTYTVEIHGIPLTVRGDYVRADQLAPFFIVRSVSVADGAGDDILPLLDRAVLDRICRDCTAQATEDYARRQRLAAQEREWQEDDEADQLGAEERARQADFRESMQAPWER